MFLWSVLDTSRSLSYIYAFSRRFYPKLLTVHSDYTYFFFVSMCVPWELNPQPFALLTQCSTTEPQEHLSVRYLRDWQLLKQQSMSHWPSRMCFCGMIICYNIHQIDFWGSTDGFIDITSNNPVFSNRESSRDWEAVPFNTFYIQQGCAISNDVVLTFLFIKDYWKIKMYHGFHRNIGQDHVTLKTGVMMLWSQE